MFDHKKKLVVTAGLAGILAFGAMGCSTQTETTTTTTVEENGSETTTTTTTKTDENGSETTTTTTSTSSTSEAADGPITYNNEALGFMAELPEAFKESEPEADADGDETVLYATNDEGETVVITYRDLAVEPKFDTSAPWASWYAESLQKALESNGEESVSVTETEGKLAGVPCTIVECRSKGADGSDRYRDYFFMVADTEDGPKGLYTSVIALSEESLDELENCFRSIA